MPTGAEIPQHVLTPEYWDGHTFQSSECPHPNHPDRMVTYSLPWRGWWRFIQEIRYQNQQNKYAKSLLEAYFLFSDKSIEKRLRLGDTFDSKNYPLGTIVRFNRESLSIGRIGGLMWLDPTYVNYGVLCQYEEYPEEPRFLMLYFGSRISNGKIYDYGKPYQALFTVGEVDHHRPTETSRYESLLRCNWLEVLQFGKGVPIRARQFSLFGKTVPELGK